MSASQQQPPPAPNPPDRGRLTALIGGQVIEALGQPPNLHQVQVVPLWSGRYRVNVFTGRDAASAQVAHSYFVATDGDGQVVDSTPAITRQY